MRDGRRSIGAGPLWNPLPIAAVLALFPTLCGFGTAAEPNVLPAQPHGSILTSASIAPITVGPAFLQPAWTWQLLPEGLLYKSYLAGPHEPQLRSSWLYEKNDGWIWDLAVGGRVGILRLGTNDVYHPQGWQLDIEGAAFPRLNMEEQGDLDATDFRFGIPLTWQDGPFQMKLAYYHLSSHVGDEFLQRNPGFTRINYTRDAIVLGAGCFPVPSVRLYGEAGYGFATDGGSEPWELQFGGEWAPPFATGPWGAPFLALNAHVREEVDWGGAFSAMAGWAWRADRSHRLFRAGLHYQNGKTSQFEFLDESEQLIGLGLWLDY